MSVISTASSFQNVAGAVETLGGLRKKIIKTDNVQNNSDSDIDSNRTGENKKENSVSESKNDNQKSDTAPGGKEVEQAAAFASSVTGVRKDFIMGMLAVESEWGKNPGKCTYEEVERGAERAYSNGRLGYRAWNNFIERREKFKVIASDLGYDYKTLKVSCNPSNYAGTGGAMGIPQFMPDTWFEYKGTIAKAVGKETPDPWNVRDGVVAMAVKLADVPGVKQHNYWAERNAAKIYLSGTTSSEYDWYANKILYWAENYHQVIG